ncbi:MAG TPA: NHLP bacteriocin system secretion protein [Candidatus Angelobacter sp.]|jgi:HlyD family secretion protein
MNTSIFRKVSLDRLSSPEQLDQMLQVTSLRGWIGLVGIFLLLVTAVIWGFWGRIPTTAGGEGVIVRSGGVINVVTRGGGLVLNLNAQVGERIRADQVIATIAQPVLSQKIKSIQDAMAEATRERNHSLRMLTDSARLQMDALERERANDELQIRELNEQATLTSEQATADDQLATKGLITRQQALATKQKLVNTQDQIANLTAHVKQLDAQKFSIESQPQKEDTQMQDRISNLQRDLAAAEKELSLEENVVSPYDGQVLELKVSAGANVSMGAPILSIQPDAHNLELVAYISSSDAKEIKNGMQVQVSPSSIKREEYGFMKGETEHVSDYPATPAALMRNFENESLTQVLSSTGPVTEVRVSLKLDPGTPSGFQWSASKGPPVVITSGTICTVRIVTQEQQPISLVFPYIKKKLGLT